MRVLISWIGNSDLMAAHAHKVDSDLGPILRFMRTGQSFDRIHLFNDIPDESCREKATPSEFENWLANKVGIESNAIRRFDCEPLRNNYDRAYQVTRDWLQEIRTRYPANTRFALLLSPGFPAAQVAMIIAVQSLFHIADVELFNTSKERDCELVRLPYLISVDVAASALNRWQQKLTTAEIHPAFAEIIGSSLAVQQAKQMASCVARYHSVNVLIRGESGTGKELFARCIHHASQRAEHAFLPVNCAAIPAMLLESLLFGHVRGAFTGADRDRSGLIDAANGGTLFLDEIGDMPPELQAKLLRFLQEGTYHPVGVMDEKSADVRILAATHRDLDEAIRTGQFRGDLFYRLDQVSLNLPPLRERGKDARELARQALDEFYQVNDIPESERRQLTEEALDVLQRHPWPGNVRELKNAISRLAVFGAAEQITGQDVDNWLAPPPSAKGRPLRELDAVAFLNHLAATFDELLGCRVACGGCRTTNIGQGITCDERQRRASGQAVPQNQGQSHRRIG